MFKVNVLISILIFAFLLVITSIIKNQSRDIEKKIFNLSKIIHLKEKDLNESQLDFFYLTSPSIIEEKILHIDNYQYEPMKYSNLFFSFSDFINLENKFATQSTHDEKKVQKK
tara:strand:+ start:99 stop:437 length:339 start_codon:yes stop_codon:yes gene_type:complete